MTDKELSEHAYRETVRLRKMTHKPQWRDWYSKDGTYLGVVSARTGPDTTDTRQKCECVVCTSGRPQNTQGNNP